MKNKIRVVLDKLAKKARYITQEELQKSLELQREKCAVRASYRFNGAKSSKDMFGAVINTCLVTENRDTK